MDVGAAGQVAQGRHASRGWHRSALVLPALLVLATVQIGAAGTRTPATAQVAAARTLVVPAAADTTVRQAQPTTAFGTAATLLSDQQELSTAGSAATAYLRFEVPGLAPGETITGAALRLRTTPSSGGTSNGPAIWRTADTPTASATSSLTWNSRPARRGTTPVGNIGAAGHDVHVSTAVQGVTGNGWVSFELAPESSDGLVVRSREDGTADRRPQLVLTVTSGGGSWPTDVGGRWATPIASLPQRTVHAAVLHTGKVLLVAGSGNRLADFSSRTFKSYLWDPGTNALTALPNAPYDFFCAGHSFLPDGRLLVAGGTSAWESSTRRFGGIDRSVVFDPVTATYTSPSTTMTDPRWYPTVVDTGDGKRLAVSGYLADGSQGSTAEAFDVATGRWTGTTLTQAFPNYPQLTLAADGRLFYSGQSHQHGSSKPAGLWDVRANTFTAVPGLTSPLRRNSGGTVLLPPAQAQKVLTVGGGDRDGALADANVVDLTRASPAYVSAPKVPFSDGSTGVMHNSTVLLPDGKVLVTGGTRSYIRGTTVRSSAVYDPARNAWHQVNPHTRPRGYHSTAVLLPDGRVATFGHDLDDEATFDLSVEVWSPPYLFAGTRPTITAAPTQITRGSSFTVSAAASGATLHRFVLVRPSAVTHSLDPDQRVVALGMTATTGGASLAVPSNRNLAPAGWYMLFAVDSLHRPSTARWVHLG